jgi:hypothetical protein
MITSENVILNIVSQGTYCVISSYERLVLFDLKDLYYELTQLSNSASRNQ